MDSNATLSLSRSTWVASSCGPGSCDFFDARLCVGARASWSSVLGEMRMCDNSSCGDIHSPVLGLVLVCLRAAAEPDAAGSVTRRARARVSDGDKLVPALRARPMIGARGGLLAAGRYRRVIGPTTTATALGSFKAL